MTAIWQILLVCDRDLEILILKKTHLCDCDLALFMFLILIEDFFSLFDLDCDCDFKTEACILQIL